MMMLRRSALVCATLVLAACAALLNSGRPKYGGPVIKLLWHNSTLQVTDTPVIRAGVVYAIKRGIPKRGLCTRSM